MDKQFLNKTIINMLMLVSGLCCYETNVSADMPTNTRPIVVVAPFTKVHSGDVTLGDVCVISEVDESNQALVALLSKVALGESPPASLQKTILGASVLEAVQSAGIDPESIVYSIPRTLVIEREGRVLSKAEIFLAVKERFDEIAGEDIRLKDVESSSSVGIPVGDTSFEVEHLGNPSRGKLPLRISVKVDQQIVSRFSATGVVDHWQLVPVAKREMDKGAVISVDDLQMVRMNLSSEPEDFMDSQEQAIGKRVKAKIVPGDVIRSTRVDVPPMVPKGARVSLIYETGALKAVAIARALEDGQKGDAIQLRNERSRRIVKGRIVSATEVRVSNELL